jgi:predicted phage terminase large subunit-like protein
MQRLHEADLAGPAGTRFVRGWDLAGTDQAGDWTAGLKLGVQPDGRYIIANVVREQRDPEDVEKMLKATATGDGTGVEVAIPQDPGQAGKSQARALVRLLSGFTVKTLPVSGDKVTRARPFAAQVNAGNVDMLRGDWNDALKSEMRNFPNGKHDDQVDAGALAFDRLTSGNTGLLDFYRQEAEETARMRDAGKVQDNNTTTTLDLRGEVKRQQSGPAAFMQE